MSDERERGEHFFAPAPSSLGKVEDNSAVGISQSNGAVANVYAKAGVSVFPCRSEDDGYSRAKSPHTNSGQYDATCDQIGLVEWRSNFPRAIYGIPCSKNNIIVLDADRHGKADGPHILINMFAQYGFDYNTVPIVKTAGNGIHAIFQRPTWLGQVKGKLTDALDVKDNGYVIAAGSWLPDGRRYELLNGPIEKLAEAIAGRTLPVTPDWLVALLRTNPIQSGFDFDQPISFDGIDRKIEGLARTVREARQGTRNSTLYWAACRIGEMTFRTDLRVTAASRLGRAAMQAGLSEHEARNTILSGIRTGMEG